MDRITLENVSKQIKGVEILTEINQEFKSGRIYGLCGYNGSGKTMLLRMMAGLIRPSSGRVIVDGKTLHKDIDFPESIGALIENPSFLNPYSGYKNLEILQSLYKEPDPDEIMLALERVGLSGQKDIKYGQYSLGMKQKLGIAFAILETPDIIVLDEPINALDEESVAIIRETLFSIRDEGKIIIIACHDREEMDYLSDKVYIMKDGRIIEEESI